MLTKAQAIALIADGHTFWRVGGAKKICKAFDLKLPEWAVSHYKGQKDANPTNHFKGLFLKEDKPCSGVNALTLSNYITERLCGKNEMGNFLGRGFVAQANCKLVSEKLGIKPVRSDF